MLPHHLWQLDGAVSCVNQAYGPITIKERRHVVSRYRDNTMAQRRAPEAAPVVDDWRKVTGSAFARDVQNTRATVAKKPLKLVELRDLHSRGRQPRGR